MSEVSSEPVPVIEVTVAAPVQDVWRALRDPDLLRNWHGWDYEMPDGGDGLDAEIQVIYFNEAVIEEPPTRLFLGTDVIDLTETDEGVRVRLTRAPHGANPDWDAYYDDITEGWTTFLHQLKWAVQRHPGQMRVTHFAVGRRTNRDRLSIGSAWPTSRRDRPAATTRSPCRWASTSPARSSSAPSSSSDSPSTVGATGCWWWPMRRRPHIGRWPAARRC